MKEGDKFGRLTAVRKLEDRVWEFMCDCGMRHLSFETNVINGATKSCGCLKKERLQKMAGDNATVGAELTEELKELIHRHGLEVSEMAQVTGLKMQTVRKWTKRYGSTITLKSMEKLREYTRCL